MDLTLIGTEAISLELSGSLDHDAAQTLTGPLFQPQNTDGKTAIGLLIFRMRGLRPRGLPGLPMNYSEALWRIRVEHGGAPAWFVVACDVDRTAVRWLARVCMRYPVRPARFELAEEKTPNTFQVLGVGEQRITITTQLEGVAAVAAPPLPTLVRSAGSIHQIPWNEEPAPIRHHVRCAVAIDTLGEATLGPSLQWEPTGLIHRGRIHKCGLARRVSTAAPSSGQTAR